MSKVQSLILSAIEKFGTEAKLAEAAGISQPVINEAKKTGRVGPRLAIGLEKATRGEIKRSDLRPDLWEETPPEWLK